MTYDMLIRKKVLKIQERLGMRIGVMYGTKNIPVIKTTEDAMNVLRELYKIGIKAFVLPSDLFSDIMTTSDLYKKRYGELLKIKELAKKFNIELSLHYPSLSDQPDEILKTICNIRNIMDARTFIIRPNFYRMMPQDQALKLVVYKINEIVNDLKINIAMGVETTGRVNELGSLEDVLDIVRRSESTEPIINWSHIHARGSGALKTRKDFENILNGIKEKIGTQYFNNAYFIFSGVSYGPSGVVRNISYDQADIKLETLIHEIMSFNIKGTLIFDDPEKEQFILKMLENLADMVR